MSAPGLSGKAFVYGDNIDTDMLAPGIYMKFAAAEIAKHCLEAIDPDFAKTVRPGDIVVGGENFGMGSSREQAVMAPACSSATASISASPRWCARKRARSPRATR